MSEESTAYDATVIVVLTGPEAVRKRPGMYIGSVGERGLHHLVFEAAEWALEEVIGGAGGRVVVTLTADGGVRIDHDGEALPVDHDGGGDSLRTRLTVIGGRARPAGRRSLDGGFATHGLGLSVVNALSSRLTAEVRRDGARWVLEYERGEEVAPPTRSGPAGDTGTVITFRPDAEVFEALEFSFDTLVGHFREVASLNRELDITLADDRDPGEPRADRLHFPGGLGEALAEQSCVSPSTRT